MDIKEIEDYINLIDFNQLTDDDLIIANRLIGNLQNKCCGYRMNHEGFLSVTEFRKIRLEFDYGQEIYDHRGSFRGIFQYINDKGQVIMKNEGWTVSPIDEDNYYVRVRDAKKRK